MIQFSSSSSLFTVSTLLRQCKEAIFFCKANANINKKCDVFCDLGSGLSLKWRMCTSHIPELCSTDEFCSDATCEIFPSFRDRNDQASTLEVQLRALLPHRGAVAKKKTVRNTTTTTTTNSKNNNNNNSYSTIIKPAHNLFASYTGPSSVTSNVAGCPLRKQHSQFFTLVLLRDQER